MFQNYKLKILPGCGTWFLSLWEEHRLNKYIIKFSSLFSEIYQYYVDEMSFSFAVYFMTLSQ